MLWPPSSHHSAISTCCSDFRVLTNDNTPHFCLSMTVRIFPTTCGLHLVPTGQNRPKYGDIGARQGQTSRSPSLLESSSCPESRRMQSKCSRACSVLSWQHSSQFWFVFILRIPQREGSARELFTPAFPRLLGSGLPPAHYYLL